MRKVLACVAVLAGGVVLMHAVPAMPGEDARAASPVPLYYKRAEPVTAQLLFPQCRAPLEAGIKEQCALVAARIDFLEAKLKRLCGNAGESIVRTAENVQGVYVHAPQQAGDEYWHEHEGAWELFVSPTFGPHYGFWEVDRVSQGNKVLNCRYETEPQGSSRAKTRQACKGLPAPESEYGVSWRALTSEAEQRQEMMFGDETTVFNLRTNETLATRRIYFYVIRDNALAMGSGRLVPTPGRLPHPGVFVRSCPGYSPREDDGYVDKRPRHSVEFVARVLRPRH